MSAIDDLNALRDRLKPSARMPVVFLGHGSPMNALEDTEYSRAWTALGKSLPEPAAILVVSAHWMTRGTTLVDVSHLPKTIHDFYGFPDDLFAVEYPAPGAPDVAIKEISSDRVRGSLKRRAEHFYRVRDLTHPNLVQLQAFFCVDGKLYVVMEWVEGRSLADMTLSEMDVFWNEAKRREKE